MFFHTDEDVKGYIDRAEKLLVESGYNDTERIALLPTILNLISAHNVMIEQAALGGVDLGALRGKVGH
jgi:hypothetical protein